MKSKTVCDCSTIHQDIVNNVRPRLFDNETLLMLADFFKVFGDSTRLKIIQALACSKMCVCDISVLLDMKQSAISHQLRVLRKEKLVSYKKEGTVVYYSLSDNHVKKIFQLGYTHIKEKQL